MSRIVEVHIPKYPECWTSCGNCGSGEVSVDDVRVLPGDAVARDDTLIVLETGKVAIDIPAPTAGTVVELFLAAGDLVGEGRLILTLEVA
jgi:pyruvate/2-oxoglutarate dehydrogenase complex dihydrolipoamide acyltransferase (E2) component